jgi:phage terminase large subunit-like protein
VSTGWPAVEQVCKVGFKITFDPWQEGAGKAMLGKGRDRLYCADAIVLSIPRQVGKTFLVGAIIFALSIVNPGTLTLWTAHRAKTAGDTFKDLKAFAQRREVAPHIEQIFDSANDQRIVFKNGSVIHFGARERGFGRGFKKVAIVVFDEAQILTSNGVDDMVPATNRHTNPLIFYIGTPPKPSDPGEHFAMLRREALDGESDTTLYIEFSADKPPRDPRQVYAWVRDKVQWAKANPSFPFHTTARAMLRMLKNLGVESFIREALGVWDEDATSKPFAPGSWAKLKKIRKRPPTPAALGIAADLDQVWLSLGSASGGKKPHLGSVLRVRADHGEEEFVAEVARIQKKYRCAVVIDPKGPAGYLIDALENAGVTLTRASQDDFVQASADIRRAVAIAGVEHGDYDELNEAVDAAGWRHIGDRKVIGRKSGDIAMLEAVTLALWAARLNNYDVEDSFL